MRILHAFSFFIVSILWWQLPVFSQNNIQEFPHSAQYFYLMPLYNPAFGGELDQAGAQLNTRFVSNDRHSPLFTDFMLQGEVLTNMTLGLTGSLFSYDDDLKTQQYRVGLLGAFNFDFSENTIAKIGVNAGLIHYANKNGPNGTALPSNTQTERYFRTAFDAGLMLKWKRFTFGAAFSNLNEPTFQYYSAPYFNSNTISALGAKFNKKAYFSLCYDWELDDNLLLQPQALVRQFLGISTINNNTVGRYPMAATVAELTVLAHYKRTFGLGFTYKVEDPLYVASFSASYAIKQRYRLSAAYNLAQKDLIYPYSYIEVGLGILPWLEE